LGIVNAFKAFFAVMGGSLPDDLAAELGYVKKTSVVTPKAAAPAPAGPGPREGALQLLGILQRDARLVDFLMEDIAGYDDEQIGAAVRDIHSNSRTALLRYARLSPIIDGVEGAQTRVDAAGSSRNDPAALKLIGNVPADGKAQAGILRHKGWRAESMELPALPPKANLNIVAPAELEIE
jgi:hypothetical protein